MHPSPLIVVSPLSQYLQGTLTFNHRQIGNPAGRYGTVSFPTGSQPLVGTEASMDGEGGGGGGGKGKAMEPVWSCQELDMET